MTGWVRSRWESTVYKTLSHASSPDQVEKRFCEFPLVSFLAHEKKSDFLKSMRLVRSRPKECRRDASCDCTENCLFLVSSPNP